MSRKPLIPLYVACKKFGFICGERPKLVKPGKCQWCGKEIKGTRRKSFCSTECSQDFNRIVVWGRRRNAYSTQIVWRDKLTCQDCGKFLALKNEYGIYIPIDGGAEVHHILPVAIGGDDNPNNLITLCKECHIARHKELRER